MSEILKFVFDNYGSLRPLDYLLLLVVVALVTASLFLFFRWLFRTRFEAQKELLAIREETIAGVERQLRAIEKDADRAKTEAIESQLRLAELDQRFRSAKERSDKALQFSYQAQSALLFSSIAINTYARLAMVYELLYLYQITKANQLDGAPSPAVIERKLAHTIGQLQGIDGAFKPLWAEELDLHIRIDFKSFEQKFNPLVLGDEMMLLANSLIEWIEKTTEPRGRK